MNIWSKVFGVISLAYGFQKIRGNTGRHSPVFRGVAGRMRVSKRMIIVMGWDLCIYDYILQRAQYQYFLRIK